MKNGESVICNSHLVFGGALFPSQTSLFPCWEASRYMIFIYWRRKHRPRGATVARSTPDRKVIRSNRYVTSRPTLKLRPNRIIRVWFIIKNVFLFWFSSSVCLTSSWRSSHCPCISIRQRKIATEEGCRSQRSTFSTTHID